MTIVVDSSVVVAFLTDVGDRGAWAAGQLDGAELAAPHILPAEVASALRRMVHTRRLSPEIASLAHADIGRLSIDLAAYEPFAPRIWRLKDNVTTYDAWYVALAESLDVVLVTGDSRLARAHGPRCRFELFPGG